MMQKLFVGITLLFLLLFLNSCSKKNTPSKTASASITYKYDSTYVKSNETVAAKKTVVRKKQSPPLPEIITVNDAAAKKSVDGRLYYDVEGHRYWKNFKDGKYYLFNKKMYKNPDFKPRSD